MLHPEVAAYVRETKRSGARAAEIVSDALVLHQLLYETWGSGGRVDLVVPGQPTRALEPPSGSVPPQGTRR
jgi:hypothetical protein